MAVFIPMKIAVLYNKPAARFLKETKYKDAEDDTEESAYEVEKALVEKGVTVDLVPLTEDRLHEGVDSISADLVFNLIEWTGIDTHFAMKTFDLLNAKKLKYTGSTKENYFNTCDKLVTKRICRTHRLPTAQWQEFVTGSEEVKRDLLYPMLVKVSNEHSSAGIATDSIVNNAGELVRIVKKRIEEFQQPVFAETFLTGREFQITLLEKADGLTVLPIAEVHYKEGTDAPLLTYAARWDATHKDYANSTVAVANIHSDFGKDLELICKRAYSVFGFRDYTRFDIRCDKVGNPNFLELNSNPGLGDDPEYCMTVSYKAAGMTFSDFVWEIVLSAKRRYGM